MIANNVITHIKDNVSYARGIFDSKKAYKGPHFLELHITHTCNLNCVGCYSHSFRKPDRFSNEWKQKKISKDVFVRIINEVERMEVRSIVLCGYGEPFMHPDILDFIRYIKQKKMRCRVVTNGTLINEEILVKLSLIRLDHLSISLWECNPQRYAELKPGHREGLGEIEKWLESRKMHRLAFPKVNLLFLLNNRNYHMIDEMCQFAEKYNIDYIHFKLFKVYQDMTQDYLLSQEQIALLIKRLEDISGQIARKVPTNAKYFIRFLRKVSIQEHLYLNDYLQRMPCYIGWLYILILLNGDVIPCCGCRRYVLGNIYANSLSEIWSSKRYQEFRHYALTDKSLELFNNCQCGKLCSHYQLNLRLNKYFGMFANE